MLHCVLDKSNLQSDILERQNRYMINSIEQWNIRKNTGHNAVICNQTYLKRQLMVRKQLGLLSRGVFFYHSKTVPESIEGVKFTRE